MESEIYNNEFFDFCAKNNYLSAKKIVPTIMKIFSPKSLIDYGCGVGCWLRAFIEEAESLECKGIDGYWLKGQDLMVPEECIEYADLMSYVPKRKYDMAISLEVAEHLDSKYEDIFIKKLIDSSDVIVFSAAIPQQGGTGHVNERWQSYWIGLFQKYGYIMFDFLRQIFWNDDDTGIYRQNIFVFINSNSIRDYHKKIREFTYTNNMVDVVHPVLYAEHKIARKFKDKSEKLDEMNKKNRYLFELMINWINKKNEGKKMSDVLNNMGVTEVAIYGAGILGECVYKEIWKSIHVLYVTDFYKDSFCYEVPFYKYKNNSELPYARNILVTAPCDYKKIKSELMLRFLDKINIINISDIIFSM